MFTVNISVLLGEGQAAITDEELAPFVIVGHPGAWPIYFSYLGQHLRIRSDMLPDVLPEALQGLPMRIEVEVNPTKQAQSAGRRFDDPGRFRGPNLFRGRVLIYTGRGFSPSVYQEMLPILRALSPLVEGENFSQ